MRSFHRRLSVFAAATVVACASTLSAAEPVVTADAVGDETQPSLIQRISHALFQPGWGHGGGGGGGVVNYGMFSTHYSLWQSPDLYTDDMRCRPTPFAPRGYGWPKKTSSVRLDYAPYVVQGWPPTHGLAQWPRSFRDPCCDCGQCEHCRLRGECEQCGSRDCRQSSRYAPRP